MTPGARVPASDKSNSAFAECGGDLSEGLQLESLVVPELLPRGTANLKSGSLEGLAWGYELVRSYKTGSGHSVDSASDSRSDTGGNGFRVGAQTNGTPEMTNPTAQTQSAPEVVYVDRPSPDFMANSEPVNPGKGRDLQKLHRLLRGRYHWAVLLSLLLGICGAVGGFRLGQKTYQSGGIIRVLLVVPRILYTVDDKGQLPAFDAFVDAQVALIRSQRVIDQALDDGAWNSLGVTKSDEALIKFTNSLDVSRQGDMILVKATNPDPQVAMTSVNSVIDAYNSVYKEIEAQSDNSRRQVREEYKTKLTNDYGANQQTIRDIAKKYGSDDLRPQFNFALSESEKLEVGIGELRRSLTDAPKGIATSQPTELTADELYVIDGKFGAIVDNRNRCADQVARLNADLGPKHPTAIAARADLKMADDEVQDALRKYNAYRLSHPGAPASSAGLTAPEIQDRIDALQKMEDQRKVEMNVYGGEQLEIERLRNEGEALKAELDETSRAIEQMELESQITGRISVMSRADKPLAPFRDTRPTYAGAGATGGVVVGFGAIMLVGLIGRRLDRPEDAQTNIVGLPLLGVLAKLPDDLADPEQAAVASHQVHQIRTLLQIMGQESRQRVFGITSPAAGTGKTSLTLALGISFATAQLKTLMIDCDLVGGGLTDRVSDITHQKIGQILQGAGIITEEQLREALKLAEQSNRRLGEILMEAGHLTEAQLSMAIANQSQCGEVLGVLNALAGEDLRSCVTETGIDRLWILPLGGASPQHAGRLSPDAFHQMIEAARKQFDVVLVDTGPVPGSLEASVVASQVDAVVLTVSRGEQTGFVDGSVSHLVSVGAKIAGLVFNRARTVDVFRYGSSGLSSNDRIGSIVRGNGEMSELTAESKRFGPVARAVASHVPASKST